MSLHDHVGDLAHHDHLAVSDVYVGAVRGLYEALRPRTNIRILIVVDGAVSLTEAPGAFGVGRLVRLLRESHVGCNTFTVDLARRDGATATNNSPAAHQPRYTGFRFDQQEGGHPVVNRYDEVWCFGFNPGNDAGDDVNITNAAAFPASDNELKVLTTWMNARRGGVLAMGDHDYLGASMAHRIPRVRSMRRWTNAQNVPPIGGIDNPDTHLRHDTNQPATPGQISSGDLIPNSVQRDAIPQPMEWVPWLSQYVSVLRVRQRPHPILCHPTHGPIDVMPDHPHEGWCYEDDEIDLDATYDFDDLEGPEYPLAPDGTRPQPRVIAYGTTTPNPPFNLQKGPSPEKRFAMVNAYDGHPARVGRVVTDSTWHHWFDENIQNIEAAGGENWDKISRYFLNVAVWLAPPSIADWCLVLEVVRTHFTHLGFQEYNRKASTLDLGVVVHSHLARYLGPCWVSRWLIDNIHIVDDDLWAWLKEKLFWKKGFPGPGGPCLSCPPFEVLEIVALGGLVRATFAVADEVKAAVARGEERALKLDVEDLEKLQLEGMREGLREFRTRLARDMEELQPLARAKTY